MKYHIFWFGIQPTPYNDYLFENLADDPEINLLVYYFSSVISSHPWQSALGNSYPTRQYNKFIRIDWQILSLPFSKKEAFFIVAGWNHLTNQLLLTLLKLLGKNYAIWTDTPYLNRNRNRYISYFRNKWLRWIFSGANSMLGTGEPGITNLALMGACPERLINFPFFLNLNSYKRTEVSFGCSSSRVIKFISSGRLLNKLKGHDIAIRALAKILQKSSITFEYFIAGTGPDEIPLKALVKQLGLENHVTFLGWLEPDSLIKLYLSADALIHPSPIHDPFPNSVLEAMAASLVVFGSDACGSVVDRIRDGWNGFIHPAGNEEVLETQLRKIIRHPNKIPEIGHRARETAEQWPIERGIQLIKQVANVS